MIKINKIEKEKFYLPTYPNFFEHATPNTNNNFFWPNRQCDSGVEKLQIDVPVI